MSESSQSLIPSPEDDCSKKPANSPATTPGGDTELVTDAMPAYWAERINRMVEKTARALVETGQELCAAKAKLKHGLWQEMFKTVQVKLDLSLAQRLMKVVANPAMTNAANLPFLPPSPTALVALSKLPPKAVEDGIKDGHISPSMSIADAAKFVKAHQPKPASDNGVEDNSTQQTGTNAKDFIVVLWDDSDADSGTLSRAPAKTYSAKNNPNLAFFRLYPKGSVSFDGRNVDGLAEVAAFAVVLESSGKEQRGLALIKDKRGIPFCQNTCQFLTLAVRGDVSEPKKLPDQIITGGYAGVIEVIGAMYPAVLKAISTTREQAPDGWVLVPRKSSRKTASDAAEVASAHSETPKLDPSNIPAVLAASPKTDNHTAANILKPKTERKTKLTTVRDHLTKLHEGFDSIAAQLHQCQENTTEILRRTDRYKARENAIPNLEAVTKQLAQIVASLGVAGDLPFITKIVPRGSRFKRVQRMRL